MLPAVVPPRPPVPRLLGPFRLIRTTILCLGVRLSCYALIFVRIVGDRYSRRGDRHMERPTRGPTGGRNDGKTIHNACPAVGQS